MARIMRATVVLWVCAAGVLTTVHGLRNTNLGDHMSRGIELSGGNSSPNQNRAVNTRLAESSAAAANKQDTCTKEFRDIPGHTMCMTDDPRVTGTGVTAQEREEIVRLHNEVRGSVQPEATDLTPLVWNDELAAVAQKWSKQCVMGHDKEHSVPGLGLSVGQNVAGGHRSWPKAIKGWHDEVLKYKFGQNPDSYLGKKGWKKIGHYTQMVQNTTYLVGCGFSSCRSSNFGRYFVCNYASVQMRLSVPYTRGRRCSACPNSCRNGLCDCGGRICQNGGTLDVNSCTCQCPPVYKGDDCSQVNCPYEDPFYCGRDFKAGDCTKYYNVPHMCPFMCKICTGGPNTNVNIGGAGGESAPPQQVFTSPSGCKYKGKRATPAECKTYGDKGADTEFCASQEGEFDCNECSRYSNIKRDYCPVMCGLCDPPCGGMVCQNGGRLDTKNCSCVCHPPFTGDNCQNTECPKEDSFHCSAYPANFCQKYRNVPEECPYKCGVCKK